MSATAVSAQEAAPQLNEILVTAQRKSESIQTVPIAITAISSETLKKQNIQSVEDYFALTPNVSFVSNGSRDRKDLSIRGISNQINPYSEVRPATYAFYIDEFNVVAGSTNPEIMDLERIEVLRGPQGTYFGRNAVGGAINVITKKPVNHFEGEVEMAYSSNDTKRIQGIINVPVVDGKLAIRAAGQYEESDGWIKNINPSGGGNGYDYKTARVQARFTPTDKLTWDFTYSTSNENSDMRVGVPTGFITATWRSVYYGGRTGNVADPDGVGFYPTNDDKVNFNRPQHVGTDFEYASTRATYEFDSATLTAVLGRLVATTFNYGDVDGSSHDFYYEDLSLRRTSTSAETRLQSSDKGPIEWSLGGVYGLDTGANKQRTLNGAESPQARPVGFETTGLDSKSWSRYYAVFGQVNWHFYDKFSLVVGGRYSHEQVKSYALNRSNEVTTGINDRIATFKDFSPRFTLSYQATPTTLVYATASRGFKSGGTQSSNVAELRNEYSPETLWNYEAGLKFELFDRRLRVDSSVFYMDWKNVQQTIRFQYLDATNSIRAVSGIDNAAGATSKGAEINLDAAVTEQLRVSAQAGYLKSKYGSYKNALIDGVIIDASGKRLINAPEWTLGAQAEYTIPLSADYSAFVRGEYQYRGETLNNVYGLRYEQYPFISPGYNTFNLRLGVESDRIRVIGFVQNLFNKKYFANAYEKAFYSGVQVEPSHRVAGVSVNYKF